jgi:hypothetical protein
MKTRTIDNDDAGQYAWAAAMDAQRRNTNNKSHFTRKQQDRAIRMRDAVEGLWRAKSVYLNYRKKEIDIKIDAPTTFDRKPLRALEKIWAADGVTKKVSKQGVIYTIDKI